ncbi:Aromatic ring-opening dioxygenase, catalytic subunit, LigB family [Meinhardsimonia xiamenensis]|uniref:Aromatic ring-opening dioxygenase, catalytic subunit, LigB family n=1 Tax=Meinhardsimonia xiamenensis TaxID=990712 RepID=A0A1G9CAI0_9RHOB|nr:class III extradiol ring-cleavage dioxygenase [Meinhardsimonia xiamenensis]PRX38432.1 aromatic ring-opening dioxygenase catalytic subunit (LigB family) [Meinhardsimonia xiamenensis]SDK48651.1 Aromatic ring-opening dioxygenase, catalytic subunit, LigB family [Meinhardsimonia xiamenensis]
MGERLPTWFISHGGGPWPWIPEMRAMFANLEAALKGIAAAVGKPRAVLCISGHWENEAFAVMHAARPPMVYDYYGFPPHTYEIVYPAPGAPELAERTAALIEGAGLSARLDDEQGFDHGTFVPLAVMYPEADVPVFQVSIRRDYDPAAHVALGRALAPLREEGVLILGSGLSYHNLRLMGPEARAPSSAFDAWLTQALALPPAERLEAVLNWEKAPAARIAHPREDHLVPLFVALGAAEHEPAIRDYHEEGLFGGVTASNFRFG